MTALLFREDAYLKTAMAVRGKAGQEIGLADVRLGQESSDSLSCDR